MTLLAQKQISICSGQESLSSHHRLIKFTMSTSKNGELTYYKLFLLLQNCKVAVCFIQPLLPKLKPLRLQPGAGTDLVGLICCITQISGHHITSLQQFICCTVQSNYIFSQYQFIKNKKRKNKTKEWSVNNCCHSV